MLRMRGEVLVPPGLKPDTHEIEAAHILANYFQCVVEFIVPSRAYKVKSADLVINNLEWEVKGPIGSSRTSTIQKQFDGLQQSRNLVIDGRYTKLEDPLILLQVKQEIEKHRRVKNVLFIAKTKQVVVCKR